MFYVFHFRYQIRKCYQFFSRTSAGQNNLDCRVPFIDNFFDVFQFSQAF